MDDPFDFDSFINWPDNPSPAHDAAKGEEGTGFNRMSHTWADQPLPSSFSPIGWPMTQEPLENASLGDAQPLAEAIPGDSVDTANEATNWVTASSIPSQLSVQILGSGQASSSTSPSKHCACIVCLRIGIVGFDILYWPRKDRAAHERTHYRQDPNKSQTPYSCPVENCRFSSKRWPDLCRHTTAKHCDNPAKFACSVIGCKYNGEGNGFTRKDKLTAHYKSMHQGQKVHGQAVRAIKPAPSSSHAEASGSRSMGAQEE